MPYGSMEAFEAVVLIEDMMTVACRKDARLQREAGHCMAAGIAVATAAVAETDKRLRTLTEEHGAVMTVVAVAIVVVDAAAVVVAVVVEPDMRKD